MKNRLLAAIALSTLTTLLTGCGGGTVQAVAPSHQSHLTAVAPESGRYVLYRATGLDQDAEPTVERVWPVSLMKGQRLGFKWVVTKEHEWDAQGGFHLVAYAGNDSRDLGPFIDRDVKYAWGGEGDDVMGYFHGRAFAHAVGFDSMSN